MLNFYTTVPLKFVGGLSCNRLATVVYPELNYSREQHNLYALSIWILDITTMANSSLNIFIYYSMGSRSGCFRKCG
jgi:hypothetical protein